MDVLLIVVATCGVLTLSAMLIKLCTLLDESDLVRRGLKHVEFIDVCLIGAILLAVFMVVSLSMNVTIAPTNMEKFVLSELDIVECSLRLVDTVSK